MLQEIDTNIWQGRVDHEDGDNGLRWHQRLSRTKKPIDYDKALVILGFACDEGVHRNQGRIGASQGPDHIRRSLASLTCTKQFNFFEYGNVVCVNNKLEDSQEILAYHINNILERNGRPIILGGGHEVAWASFSGIQKYLAKKNKSPNMGIINFDAHFDLRTPNSTSSSGTPFRQCNEYCQQQNLPFNYFVVGINPSSNTHALFDYARKNNVKWLEDTEVYEGNNTKIYQQLDDYIKDLDYLYLSICMDVFNSGYAPGVSAPAALGIEPQIAIKLIRKIKSLCAKHEVHLLLSDIAETNPKYDRDDQTAKLAARLVYEIVTRDY